MAFESEATDDSVDDCGEWHTNGAGIHARNPFPLLRLGVRPRVRSRGGSGTDGASARRTPPAAARQSTPTVVAAQSQSASERPEPAKSEEEEAGKAEDDDN
jgi:hypothetical protein